MLLIGSYAIANSDEDLREMIERFMEDDSYSSLLVIDTYNRIEHIKELRGDHSCGVVFLQPGRSHTGTQKMIYLDDHFEDNAKAFIQTSWSMLVFFD
jgi:hypothetical protein